MGESKVKSLETPERGEHGSLSRKQKSFSSLEKLLHETNMKCNLTMTKNSKLKEEIVALMKERSIFLKFFDALMNRLDAGKKVMADLIYEVSLTCDSREDYLNKMETLGQERGLSPDLHLQGNSKSRVYKDVGLKGQKRVMKSVIEKEDIRRKQRRRTIEATLDEYRQLHLPH
ncbi:unnamed protein product [Timema podura]|uniref:ODAD1 central coiled coil region domain-containing protein n=1 Tax=Timema podura TaxID=61482 RepID=A0ABN7PKZ6_TIMPD|nr:unnamed protein product [Timema podura]